MGVLVLVLALVLIRRVVVVAGMKYKVNKRMSVMSVTAVVIVNVEVEDL